MNPASDFRFELLGLGVPTTGLRPHSKKFDHRKHPAQPFDHNSIISTVENRFLLGPLTKRDAAAARALWMLLCIRVAR